MQTGLHILTEGDDADDLAGYSNVVPLFPVRPAAAEMTSIGEEFAWILDDLAVRMRGNFEYPRLLVSSAWEEH